MNIQDILGAPPQKAPAGGKKELGQEDFLKLLVAQMKHQDPSNPADNGEFLSQIAQFSMVSGIDKLGASFNGMSSNYYATQAMQAAELVGREVLTESDYVLLHVDQPISGEVFVPESTDGLNIQVRDLKGTLVKTLDAGVYGYGTNPFTWDGTDEKGEAAKPGEYTISATALVNGEQLALPLATYKRVESITVDRASSSVALHLDDKHSVGFAQVARYR